MKAERKKEIRSLVHTIPMLIKSHLVNQAFEAEKIIASTFELSEPLMDLIGGKIPPNHIDKIQEVYSDLLYRAFNIGIKSGEVKTKSTPINKELSGSDLDHEIDVRMPMYFGLKRDIVLLFKEQLGEVLNSVPEIKENIVSQFERDMDGSYRDGVKEYLSNSTTEPVPEELVSPVELPEESKESGYGDELEEDNGEDGLEEDELEEDLGEEDMGEENLKEQDVSEPEIEETEVDEAEPEEEEEEEAELEEEQEEKKPEVEEDEVKLEATAVTAFKVWNKYATNDLKELYEAQADANLHSDNAKMVYEFNNWLVQGSKPENYIPFESNIVDKSSDKSVITRLEKYAKLLKNSTAEKVLRYTLGLPVRKTKASFDEKKKPAGKGLMSKLEAYTKLLNDPEAEMVLRYTLGLPVRKSTASTKMVGPYDIVTLKEKIINAMNNGTKIVEADAENDYQTVVVDCIVAGIKNLPEQVSLEYIGNKLNITAENFAELDQKTDALAQKLDDALQLGGESVFVNLDGDFCLTYNTKVSSKLKSNLPKNPHGVLTEQDQKQIECLSRLSKSKTIRDIGKASPKVSAYMKKVLNDIRWGKLGVAEGGSKLKAGVEDIIAEVFGLDGLGYYQYLRDKR